VVKPHPEEYGSFDPRDNLVSPYALHTLDVIVVAMVGGVAAMGSVNGYQCPVLQRGRSSVYDATVDDTWQKDLTWVEIKLSFGSQSLDADFRVDHTLGVTVVSWTCLGMAGICLWVGPFLLASSRSQQRRPTLADRLALYQPGYRSVGDEASGVAGQAGQFELTGPEVADGRAVRRLFGNDSANIQRVATIESCGPSTGSSRFEQAVRCVIGADDQRGRNSASREHGARTQFCTQFILVQDCASAAKPLVGESETTWADMGGLLAIAF
jgi:hypothetical protein